MKARLLAALLIPGAVLAQTAPQTGPSPAPPAAGPAQPSGPDAWVPRSTAELVLLEKLRAQPSQVMIKAGQQAGFGTLTIAVKSCVTRPPDLPQNSAAFLEITDSRGIAPVFRGWVLSNTPAVSQLEHPVYDLRLVACR